MQRDLLIPQLEVNWPLKGSLNHPTFFPKKPRRRRILRRQGACRLARSQVPVDVLVGKPAAGNTPKIVGGFPPGKKCLLKEMSLGICGLIICPGGLLEKVFFLKDVHKWKWTSFWKVIQEDKAKLHSTKVFFEVSLWYFLPVGFHHMKKIPHLLRHFFPKHQNNRAKIEEQRGWHWGYTP